MQVLLDPILTFLFPAQLYFVYMYNMLCLLDFWSSYKVFIVSQWIEWD